MVLVDFVFAAAVAVLLTALFVGLMGWRRPWAGEEGGVLASLVFFFVLVLGAAWVGGLWLSPVGGLLWGRYWLPFVLAGIVFAVLFLATVPPRRPRVRRPPPSGEVPPPKEELPPVATGLGIAFWVLFAAFLGFIVLGYV